MAKHVSPRGGVTCINAKHRRNNREFNIDRRRDKEGEGQGSRRPELLRAPQDPLGTQRDLSELQEVRCDGLVAVPKREGRNALANAGGALVKVLRELVHALDDLLELVAPVAE